MRTPHLTHGPNLLQAPPAALPIGKIVLAGAAILAVYVGARYGLQKLGVIS